MNSLPASRSCLLQAILMAAIIIIVSGTGMEADSTTARTRPGSGDSDPLTSQQWSDFIRLVGQGDDLKFSFKMCKTNLVNLIIGGHPRQCHPLSASQEVTSPMLNRAVRLADTVRERLSAFRTANESRATVWGFLSAEDRQLLRVLDEASVTETLEIWRSLSNCSMSQEIEQDISENDQRDVSHQTENINFNTSWSAAGPLNCLNLTTEILKRSVNGLSTKCQNCSSDQSKWCGVSESTCRCVFEVELSLKELLFEAQSILERDMLLCDLQSGLEAVTTFSEDLRVVYGEGRSAISLDNITEEAANILCFATHVEVLAADRVKWSSSTSDRHRLCPEHCNDLSQILGAIDKISVSSHMPGSLTFLRHTANTHCARYSKSATQCAVIDNGEVYVQNRTNNSTNLTGKFCANFTCHYPLQHTPNKDHIWKKFSSLRNYVFSLEASWSTILGLNDSKKLNSSFLSCGMQCIEVGIADRELRTARTVMAVFGYIATAMSGFASITFILNRHRITALARRVIAYINIGFFFFSLDDLALPFKDWREGWTSPCHSDGTLRETLSEFDTCAVNAARNVFVQFVLLFFGASAYHSWYCLIVALSRMGGTVSQAENKRKELLYVTVSVTLAVVMTIVTMTQARIVGQPLTGSCLPRRDDYFYFHTIIYNIVGLGALYFVFRGLPLLFKMDWKSRKSSVRSRQRIRSPHHHEKHTVRETSTGLRRLSKLLSLYVAGLFMHGFVYLSIQYYIVIKKEIVEFEKEIAQYVTCLTFHCDRDSCPPSLFGIWIYTSNHLCSLFLSCMFSTWAFRHVYWDRYLPAVFRKSRTGPVRSGGLSWRSRPSVDSISSLPPSSRSWWLLR